MAILDKYEGPHCDVYWFYCPGCKSNHRITVGTYQGRPAWTFDGDMESPTFSPSLLHPDIGCHLFVRRGQIEYLSDCRHHLAGKTVPMEDIDECEQALAKSRENRPMDMESMG
jgi:hypothetical protein